MTKLIKKSIRYKGHLPVVAYNEELDDLEQWAIEAAITIGLGAATGSNFIGAAAGFIYHFNEPLAMGELQIATAEAEATQTLTEPISNAINDAVDALKEDSWCEEHQQYEGIWGN